MKRNVTRRQARADRLAKAVFTGVCWLTPAVGFAVIGWIPVACIIGVVGVHQTLTD
jgi:hypothetical protein